MKKYTILPLLLSVVLLACSQNKKQEKAKTDSVRVYPTVSYLNIKLDAAGHLPSNPYILTFKKGKKEIVFCGTNHLEDNSDINNPLFTGIEKQFFITKPEVCVNEGGDVSKKIYASKKEAITQNGEIGLTKILADSLKIKTVNGDMTDSLEFKELLKHYSKGEFLAYIVTERFMWGFAGPNPPDSTVLTKKYEKFIQGYIMKTGGVALTKEEQSLAFYQNNYQKLLNRPFSLATLAPTNPFDPKGKFQQIGRKSKEIRDQHLLQTIDQLLDKHNKVFVVFGGWHLLTCKPGLEMIINRKR
ncbi:hypothetical protein VRU48_07715 [Pedobacter sp. KR3-3]|uniref:TraB/GumN family protein n=1 Tax=Pedobacter albus TaxID=3113905 RepID=A0ABU7I689_9SPHI|nr:hypothetical protein [Pedobacter sp. KR3-3]MEE1944988.1 hypothetical protein [Pedobacter sp. KR3-3]